MKIPLITVYHIKKDGGRYTTKRPLFEMRTAKEEARIQKELGTFLKYYYGTHLPKCCGVYPKLIVEPDFEGKCYYICLVCGKHSTKEDMPYLAAKTWEEGQRPDQISIFEIMGRGEE